MTELEKKQLLEVGHPKSRRQLGLDAKNVAVCWTIKPYGRAMGCERR